MNITVFGANGQIGQQLINIALQNGDTVKAFVRRKGALNYSHPNLTIIVGSLADEKNVTKAIQGQDAVISTLGPHLNGGRKVKELPIRNAHEMILKVMEAQGVKRFITLATPSAKSNVDKKQIATVIPALMPKLFFPPGYQEMKGIERLVNTSKVDWTVVRIINPNVKTDGNGYTISFGDTEAKMNVSRKNVARCMYDAINEWIGKMPIVFNK
ncbi:NAD(P)-dependent oxidoreductase [Peribacillus frigoritolerans]|uniref:NAD(P)-dependent oxidoreductase n=1 Tax=Peribacillus castrilensis TaxID=2897690 RepID=UPI00296F1687|nr:NAD(P)H-binding protein [Peribacillus castrilensis]